MSFSLSCLFVFTETFHVSKRSRTNSIQCRYQICCCCETCNLIKATQPTRRDFFVLFLLGFFRRLEDVHQAFTCSEFVLRNYKLLKIIV